MRKRLKRLKKTKRERRCWDHELPPHAVDERHDLLTKYSKGHEPDFAVVLRRKTAAGRFEAIAVIDTLHEDLHAQDGVDSPHLHRYIDSEKQPAEKLRMDIGRDQSAIFQAGVYLADNRNSF